MENGSDQPPPACSGFEVGDLACTYPPHPTPTRPYQGGAESLIGFPRQFPEDWRSLEEGRR